MVGIVKNSGNMPVEVNLGLNIVARDSGLVTTIKEQTLLVFLRLSLQLNLVGLSGSPFILNSKEVLTPYYKVLGPYYRVTQTCLLETIRLLSEQQKTLVLSNFIT